MTLRLIDGFDYMPSGSQSGIRSAQGWTGSPEMLGVSTTTAFGYGNCSNWSNGTGNNPSVARWLRGRYTIPCYKGMRMLVPSHGQAYEIGIRDSMSTLPLQWYVQLDGDTGAIWLYNGNGGLIAKTTAMAFYPGLWFWLEIGWSHGTSTSTGSMEIRVNTVPVLQLTNINLIQGALILPAVARGCDQWHMKLYRIVAGGGSGDSWAIDDFYFLDSAGTINNDFLGNVRAKYMAPIGNGGTIQWTIGGTAPAATNWQSVLNTGLNDTKYVYASTVGFQDLYQVNPNVSAPTIFGVQVAGSYRQDDATQRFVTNVVDSNGTQQDGATQAINQSYTFYNDIFELDPDTGLGWTQAALNAIEVGPKVIT